LIGFSGCEAIQRSEGIEPTGKASGSEADVTGVADGELMAGSPEERLNALAQDWQIQLLPRCSGVRASRAAEGIDSWRHQQSNVSDDEAGDFKLPQRLFFWQRGHSVLFNKLLFNKVLFID